jgi:hypothetical protein
MAVHTIVIDTLTTTNLYVGSEKGVFISTNGGEKWLPFGLSTIWVETLAIDSSTTTILYAGTGNGVYSTQHFPSS